MPEENEGSSFRMNIRIPMEQYKLMKKHGAVMGLMSDASCVKHFLALGLQATAGTLSSVISSSVSVEFMQEMMKAMKATDGADAVQPDIVEEAEKCA